MARNADIEKNLNAYLGERSPHARYTSFDYYFNYFQSAYEDEHLDTVDSRENLQLSCLQLGFYLASWGMYRGSAELPKHSVKSLEPTIHAIRDAPAELWAIDVDDYSQSNIQLILGFAENLRVALPGNVSNTLVTKIMLGVFGCVPAFDAYFKSGFGVTTFSSGSLRQVGQYYQQNKEQIEGRRVATLDYDTETPTSRLYTRAKVIDMIFFIEGA
jgi:hypothetical protein